MMIDMDSKIIWMADYTNDDIDAYTKILDLGLPLPYGFVIPRSLLHSVFLNLEVQEKLIPLFELTHEDDSGEVGHVRELIRTVIDHVRIPKDFSRTIRDGYEHILEKEKQYLRLHVSDFHRAAHILKHIYSPPVVRVSLLPYSKIAITCSGDQSLIHSISMAVTAYLQQNVGKGRSIDLPSVLVQRVQNGQYSGYCESVNKTRANNNQLVVYGNCGAQVLEEAGDVYILEKDSMKILHRHVLTQPYKYVLKGTEYRRVTMHEEDGKRQILPDSLIMKIGYLTKDIERNLYFPQKVFWTLENGNLYVTKLKQI